ncbi:hypothetical protein PSTG_10446 [Puccinia striiformis f. sp. tritici PST-78]|uniref:Uncharacterized protein n=1 Tax=Puccinia striiformis f. sp. tritici PST-78 TaxID=1165861 RepID=A0A0L0VAL9_9BASI|nr:hypothetical protein PSTG_10446 [Puccinia striiformis f. sp. tritici PST-78]
MGPIAELIRTRDLLPNLQFKRVTCAPYRNTSVPPQEVGDNQTLTARPEKHRHPPISTRRPHLRTNNPGLRIQWARTAVPQPQRIFSTEFKVDGAQEAEQQIDSSEPKPRSKKRTLSQSQTIYAGDSQGEKRAQDVVDTHQIQDPDYERLVPELIGHVPIPEISSYYTQRLSGHLKEDKDGDGEQTGNSIKGLDEMFSVGQWIQCL